MKHKKHSFCQQNKTFSRLFGSLFSFFFVVSSVFILVPRSGRNTCSNDLKIYHYKHLTILFWVRPSTCVLLIELEIFGAQTNEFFSGYPSAPLEHILNKVSSRKLFLIVILKLKSQRPCFCWWCCWSFIWLTWMQYQWRMYRFTRIENHNLNIYLICGN